MTVAEFLARFDHVKVVGGQWLVNCPAHADRQASLAVREGRDGRVLLHCHAGCSSPRILAAMGLAPADLFTSAVHSAPTARPPTARIVTTYDYRDEHGELLYQVVRLEPKAFFQRRPDGAGGWIRTLADVRRVLYRLPELAGRDDVLVVEGEKDVDVCWATNLAATCNVGGAGKWRDEYTRQLVTAGVRRIAIVPDNDEPGRTHADQVARSGATAGLEVRLVSLPDLPLKGDLSDYLAHHRSDDLSARVQAASPYPLASGPSWPPPHGHVQTVRPSSLTVTSPKPHQSTGRAQPEPVLIRMSDIQSEPVSWLWSRRLARGKLTTLMGDPGLGKSFLTLDLAARMTTGRPWPDGEPTTIADVILLTAEDGLADTVRPRLDACGADPRRVWILDAVRTRHGDTRAFSLATDVDRLRETIDQTKAVLVIIDPLSSYLGATESYKDTDVRRVLGPVVRLAQETRVALVGLLHLNKDTKAGALYRGMASMAFVSIPRIVLVVGPDPTEPDAYRLGAQRTLASLKQNICAPATPWAYAIEHGRVRWIGPRQDLQAHTLLAGTPFSDAEARQDVETFLRACLASGPRLQTDVVREAAAHGITESRLFRTRRKICECEKGGFGTGRWYWRLKADLDSPGPDASQGLPTSAKNGDFEATNLDQSTTSSFFAPAAKNEAPAKNGGGAANNAGEAANNGRGAANNGEEAPNRDAEHPGARKGARDRVRTRF